MRWILIILLMCNGIYFLWQNYLLDSGATEVRPRVVATQSSQGSGLVLLSEVEAASLNVDGKVQNTGIVTTEETERGIGEASTQLSETKADTGPKAPAICWQIGPFKEEVSGKQVVSRLAAMDISLKLQSIELPGEPDYWVHISPQVSRKAALKLLRELQAKKIDSFLISEGELANGISLGFFTDESRANSIFEQRKEQGYEAKIKVVPRNYTEMWAIFDEGEHGKFSDNLWSKIREGNQGLERRKNYCDKIDSADNFD